MGIDCVSFVMVDKFFFEMLDNLIMFDGVKEFLVMKGLLIL